MKIIFNRSSIELSDMKKVFIYLFLSACVGLQINCSTETANENSGQTTNANATVTTPTVAADQANVNAVAAETPLPTFTNADEALTVGKKLLDDLEAEKAVEVLRQAVKLNPDLADAHFNLGIAYALLEKVAEDNPPPATAEPPPTPATRKGKKNETVVLTDSVKSFENAVKAYKKVLAKNSKDDVAHFNLGRSYNKLNQDPEALKSLQQAVKLKPDDGEYQTELGVILIKLAQYEEAVAALKKAITIDETNLQAESLLEKAEAGRKRVDFGNKPKPPAGAPLAGQSKPRTAPKSETNSQPSKMPPPPPPPVGKNSNQ